MDRPIEGNILLVGEGDFSFSVALVTKLPRETLSNIIATSFESDESIKKHLHALQNISLLRDKGVTVHLNTDGTLLHTNPTINQTTFSRIIFNFPHVGGKSNHKKNRKLLDNFFASASQVLEDEGQIMVTLCKGQGGTPADQPMRAWHDSWQVVSMAANSDLILVDVIPFCVEDYRVYTSTGFRSLDKGFNTDKAVTHVFETSERVYMPIQPDGVNIVINNNMYHCSNYLLNKLMACRHIASNTDHPIHKIYCMLTDNILRSQSPSTCYSTEPWKPIRICPMAMPNEFLTKNENSSSSEKMEESFDRGYRLLNITPEGDLAECESLDDLANELKDDKDKMYTSDCHLIQDSLESIHLETMAQSSGKISICYGPTFQKCKIESGKAPFSYHMMITWPLSCDQPLSHDLVDNPNMGRLKTEIDNTVDVLIEMIRSGWCKDNSNLDFCFNMDDNVEMKRSESSILIGKLFSKTSKSANIESTLGDLKENIGSVYLHRQNDSSISLIFDVNLVRCVCLLYSATDQRLLWSQDKRVLGQFKVSEKSKKGQKETITVNPVDRKNHNDIPTITKEVKNVSTSTPISDSVSEIDMHNSKMKHFIQTEQLKSPSMYPMTFTHDMSFWERQEESMVENFNEFQFSDIIRNVTDDTVISVQLLDQFCDVKSGRTSRCYRLIFQSVDKALSYDTSWKLQSLVRLEVEKIMKITLR